MILYSPGDWGIAFAFSLQGSVFPKSFAWALPCAIVAASLNALIRIHPELEGAVHPGEKAATILHGFTFILGFLVVFRAQQANKRWEEGGALLEAVRGEWFNAFSNLLAFCNPDPTQREQTLQFQHALSRLVSLMYNCALQQVSAVGQNDFELLGLDGFDEKSLRHLTEVHDRVEVVMQWVQKMIVEADRDKIIHIAPPILSRVFNQLGNGIVKVAAARKISAYPIPFPYAQMVTFMLILHWTMTPLLCAATLSHPMWAFILSFVVTFGYWSVNYIGVELEMPFGDDANDLPIDVMMSDINKSLMSLLHERSLKVPDFQFDVETHVTFNPTSMNFDKYVETSVAMHQARLKRKGTLMSATMSMLEKEGADSSSPLQYRSASAKAIGMGAGSSLKSMADSSLKTIVEVGSEVESMASVIADNINGNLNSNTVLSGVLTEPTLSEARLQQENGIISPQGIIAPKMQESIASPLNAEAKVVLPLSGEIECLRKIAEDVRLIRDLGERQCSAGGNLIYSTMSARANKLLNVPSGSNGSLDRYHPPKSPQDALGSAPRSCCDITSAQRYQIDGKTVINPMAPG